MPRRAAGIPAGGAGGAARPDGRPGARARPVHRRHPLRRARSPRRPARGPRRGPRRRRSCRGRARRPRPRDHRPRPRRGWPAPTPTPPSPRAGSWSTCGSPTRVPTSSSARCGPTPPTSPRPSWPAWRATRVPGRPNGHVHGANLGVRADAYLRAGGFPDRPAHEDVDLVAALVASGARVVATDACDVLTSGRLVGRAPGGVRGLPALEVRGRRRGRVGLSQLEQHLALRHRRLGQPHPDVLAQRQGRPPRCVRGRPGRAAARHRCRGRRGRRRSRRRTPRPPARSAAPPRPGPGSRARTRRRACPPTP